MAPMKSQILSKKLVKPSTPTPRHLHKLKLSIMDQLIPLTNLNMIFYYSPGEKSRERCVELEKSLSDTLTKFYPLAGRLAVEDLLVDCTDEGVEFSEAQVCGRIADFVHGGSMAGQLDQFLPWECGADPATAPLAAVQINLFDCGGIVVGVRVSHKVADAFSIITFVNAWATANKTSIKKVFSPSFSLGSLFPTSNLLPKNPPPSGKNGVKIVTKRFFFSRVAIQSLVAAAGASGSVSQGAALTALLWKALIGAARSEHGHLRPSLLVYPINLRGNIGISIPGNSFGNFSMLLMERCMPEKGKMKLNDLAGSIGNAVRETDPKKTSNADDLCVMVRESFGEARREKMHNKRADVHLCASWCGLPLYEADFGWGKPVWVSSSNKYEVIHLIENRCGDGVDAWVSLYENDMAEFERDQDILAFSSQQS
ncbi:hypothetical protein RHMOL_Rhmol11G0206800 [Rhododendron molle]|uniref:Uncharacterized protein n=1 Tax=Rhododendron molle TaxID=49168 RepID=A0ACC0LUJ8_RHOML|nr:hypothetical protein RHMOL_Rhmol11G0206800 [Rhododendron molle]